MTAPHRSRSSYPGLLSAAFLVTLAACGGDPGSGADDSTVPDEAELGGALPAPTGVTATPGDGSVTLAWAAGPTGSESYQVRVRPSGGAWTYRSVGKVSSYLEGALSNGATYELQVRVKGSSLLTTSVYSPLVAATPGGTVVQPPMPPMPPTPPPPLPLSGRWVGAAAHGRGDGSSYDNRAAFSQLTSILAAAKPGDRVLLAATDAYSGSSTLTLASGGTATGKVTLEGANPDGTPGQAVFTGNRSYPYSATGAMGSTVFSLAAGASHLKISHLRFVNVGVAFHPTAPVSDLELADLTFSNIRQLLRVDGAAPLSSSSVHDVSGLGHSKALIQLGSTPGSQDLRVERVHADADWQNGDWPVGIQIGGNLATTANGNITIRSSSFSHVMMNYAGDNTQYWQGDGISTEEYDHHILIDDVTIDGAGDAGFDLKSCSTQVLNSKVTGAKRSLRKHPGSCNDTLLVQHFLSVDPTKRGGIGNETHVWAGGSHVSITDGTFTSLRSSLSAVFSVETHVGSVGGNVTVESGSITKPAAVPLKIVEAGCSVTLSPQVSIKNL